MNNHLHISGAPVTIHQKLDKYSETEKAQRTSGNDDKRGSKREKRNDLHHGTALSLFQGLQNLNASLKLQRESLKVLDADDLFQSFMKIYPANQFRQSPNENIVHSQQFDLGLFRFCVKKY
jgi:hypothetical protein